MAYKVIIDEPIPIACNHCRFQYDYLYCVIDDSTDLTMGWEGDENDPPRRPEHCKLLESGTERKSEQWLAQGDFEPRHEMGG